jgi:flavin-dependent dehydrogenase
MERGVEVRQGSPVTGAYRERNAVVLVDGEGKRHEAQVLVGADGVNGKSRTWMGIPARKKRSLLLQADFERDESDHPFDSNLVLDFSAIKYGIPGYAWFFPSVDGEGKPVFNTGITGGSYGGAGSGSLLKRAHEAVAGLHPRIRESAPAKFRYQSYPERDFSPFQANSGSRVLFVGEQIGVNPADGEGLGICCDSAAIASASIIRALDRGDFSFKDYGPSLLQSDSLALWIASRIITACLTDRRFDILFPIILNMDGDGRDFIMNHYAKIFAGVVKGWTIYTPSLLKELSFGIGQLVSSSTRLL